MAIDLNSLEQTGKKPKPPIITLYGTGKIGKTTLAASAPDPVFIRTEDGTDNVSVKAFPLAQTFQDVNDALKALAGDHDRKTLVIDSVDWLEPLIWQEVCGRNGWANIEEPGYGKGYAAAADVWREYLAAINWLRDNKELTVIQIAHHQNKRYAAPDNDPYDRYTIKLHDRASALIAEDSDVILFANYKTMTKETDVGFNKKITRALGTGQRVLHTTENPAWVAGNRYNMPPEINLTLNENGLCDFSQISQHIPYFQKQEKK